MNAFRFLAVAALSLAIAAPAFATSRTRARLITWPNPSKVGEAAVLLAEVDGLGGGAPLGSVAFTEGDAVLGARGLSAFGAGQATLAAGDHHSCSLTAAGGVACWGSNLYGALGDGTTEPYRSSPVAVSGLSSGVVAVAAHWAYNCALTIAGAVKCWGNDWSSDGHTPVEIVGLGSDIVAITVGLHACALTRTGAVKCWGRNDSGQLGDGTTTTRSTPVAVSGLSSGIVAIAAGERHTCALTKSGAVKCWGSNHGALGDGTTTDRHTPVDVPDLEAGVTAIAAGSRSTCALTQGGGVKCWGAYQLGDGRTTNHLTPVAVSGLSSDVVAIAAGPDASCAVTRTGAAKCWGYNAWGQLGDGTTTSRLTPVPVFGLSSRVVAIAVGGAHACALIYTGGVRCWGLDSDGELGDGRIFGVKPRPVTVAGFTALVRSRTWISTRTLGAGAHGLRATYPGDALHGGSSGTAAHAVR